MKNWQIQLGGWGTIFWLASFQIMQYLNQNGYATEAKVVVGYTLGFITAFSGYLFWEIWHGRWESLLGQERGIMRIFSAMPLLFLLLFGLFGFLNGIFNSMPWYYNLPFAIAGIVVAQGLIPIINHLDGTRP
jgi:ABC-type amino acid transport system permease subunit